METRRQWVTQKVSSNPIRELPYRALSAPSLRACTASVRPWRPSTAGRSPPPQSRRRRSGPWSLRTASGRGTSPWADWWCAAAARRGAPPDHCACRCLRPTPMRSAVALRAARRTARAGRSTLLQAPTSPAARARPLPAARCRWSAQAALVALSAAPCPRPAPCAAQLASEQGRPRPVPRPFHR